MTDQNEFPLDIFNVPEGSFYKQDSKPSQIKVQRRKQGVEPQELLLGLVAEHSLWAHYLWNAGRVMADYIDENPSVFKGKNVLECGAGAGLPSLVACLNEAAKVIITDFPDEDLISNLRDNVARNIPDLLQSRVTVLGHMWGKDPHLLLQALPGHPNAKFDVIILSDVVFNHSFQKDLLQTCHEVLDVHGIVLVSFTHHRPKYIQEDLNFFTLAAQPPFNFLVSKLFDTYVPAMFPDDPGDEKVRATVHFYKMSLAST